MEQHQHSAHAAVMYRVTPSVSYSTDASLTCAIGVLAMLPGADTTAATEGATAAGSAAGSWVGGTLGGVAVAGA